MARLQKSTFGDGVLLSWVAIFQLLIFFLWKRPVFIRVPLKIFGCGFAALWALREKMVFIFFVLFPYLCVLCAFA